MLSATAFWTIVTQMNWARRGVEQVENTLRIKLCCGVATVHDLFACYFGSNNCGKQLLYVNFDGLEAVLRYLDVGQCSCPIARLLVFASSSNIQVIAVSLCRPTS